MANKGTVKKGHSVNTRVMAPFDSDPTYDELKALIRREPVIGDWYFNTAATTPEYISAIASDNTLTWTSLNSSAMTLDGAFDNGKVIDGASSYANSLRVGTATDELCIYVTGGNVVMSTLSGDAADITIAPDGGDTHITGTLDTSGAFTSTGDLTVGASKLVVTAASGNVTTAGSITSTLNTGNVIVVNTDKFLVAGDTGNVTSAGTFTSTLTTGNAVVVNTNKFLVAADTGNTTVAGDLAVAGTITGTYSISSLSASTLTFSGTVAGAGTAVTLNGNNATTGTVVNLSGDALTTGKFVDADVGGASKFSVGFDGRVAIAGTDAANTLVVTAGDVVVSDGSLTLTDADNATSLSVTNDTITSGTLAALSGSAAITGTGLAMTFAGLTTGKALSIAVAGMTEGAGIYVSATEATLTTGKYIECYDGAADDFSVGKYGATVIAGNASTDVLTVTAGDVQITAGDIDVDLGIITVDNTADEANYIKRNFNGAGGAAVLTVESTHASGTAAALAVVQNGTGASNAMTITHAGTGDGLKITTSDVEGTALEVVCAASTTDSMIKVDGSTGDWIGADGVGMLNIACDGALAHANASCLNITYSGAGAATGLGTSLRIVDTGSTATSYAAYISAATGEALYVDTGVAKFDEAIDLVAGITFSTSGMLITQDATNTYLDAGADDENIVVGSTTDTDFILCGATNTDQVQWIADTATMTFTANCIGVFTGAGDGPGLVIPSHATASPNAAAAIGSIFFEVDAKKLWVNFNGGAGDWVSVTLA